MNATVYLRLAMQLHHRLRLISSAAATASRSAPSYLTGIATTSVRSLPLALESNLKALASPASAVRWTPR